MQEFETQKETDELETYKNTTIKYLYAYINVLKNSFGVSNNDLKKFNNGLKIIFNKYFEYYNDIMELDVNDDIKDNYVYQLRERFDEEFKETFIENYNKFISKAYSNDPEILLDSKKLKDLFEIIAEYPKLYAKYLILQEKEVYHYEIEKVVNKKEIEKENIILTNFEIIKAKLIELDTLFEDGLNPKSYTEIYTNTMNSLGLNSIEKIRKFNIRLMNHPKTNELDFNFGLNGDYYYDTEKNLSYIKELNTYFIVHGEFEGKEDLLNERNDLKTAIEDNKAIRFFYSADACPYMVHQANNMYYYRIIKDNKTWYYKSTKEIDEQEFNHIRRLKDLKEVIKLSDLNLVDIYTLETKTYTNDVLDSVSAVSKNNVIKILKNYNRENNTDNNKVCTLFYLKESFNAYKKALEIKRDRLHWIRFISRAVINYKLSNLENKVCNKLNITHQELYDNLKETSQNNTITSYTRECKKEFNEIENEIAIKPYLTKEVIEQAKIKEEEKDYLDEEFSEKNNKKDNKIIKNEKIIEEINNVEVELKDFEDIFNKLEIEDKNKYFIPFEVDSKEFAKIKDEDLNDFENYYVLYALNKAKHDKIKLDKETAVNIALALNDKFFGTNINIISDNLTKSFVESISKEIENNLGKDKKPIEVEALKNKPLINDDISYSDFKKELDKELENNNVSKEGSILLENGDDIVCKS